jgi:hypothetical protein
MGRVLHLGEERGSTTTHAQPVLRRAPVVAASPIPSTVLNRAPDTPGALRGVGAGDL